MNPPQLPKLLEGLTTTELQCDDSNRRELVSPWGLWLGSIVIRAEETQGKSKSKFAGKPRTATRCKLAGLTRSPGLWLQVGAEEDSNLLDGSGHNFDVLPITVRLYSDAHFGLVSLSPFEHSEKR